MEPDKPWTPPGKPLRLSESGNWTVTLKGIESAIADALPRLKPFLKAKLKRTTTR
jgi:hypothetical protein